MPDPLEVKIEIARRICLRARLEVVSKLESATLRRALNCTIEAANERDVEAILSVPHYWAIYYHDGRRAIKAKNGKFLVWFRSVEDDPRVNGGRPVKESDAKRLNLSPSQFKALRESGKLIIAKKAGPTKGKPFMSVLVGLGNRVNDIAEEELDRFIVESLTADGSLNFKGIIEL